jgi:hypothetical protein
MNYENYPHLLQSLANPPEIKDQPFFHSPTEPSLQKLFMQTSTPIDHNPNQIKVKTLNIKNNLTPFLHTRKKKLEFHSNNTIHCKKKVKQIRLDYQFQDLKIQD